MGIPRKNWRMPCPETQLHRGRETTCGRLPSFNYSVVSYRLYRDLDLLNILRLDKVIILISFTVGAEDILQLGIRRNALAGDDIIFQQFRILRIDKAAIIGHDHKFNISSPVMIHPVAAH